MSSFSITEDKTALKISREIQKQLYFAEKFRIKTSIEKRGK